MVHWGTRIHVMYMLLKFAGGTKAPSTSTRFGRCPANCRFRGVPDHDGHLFWECTFPPLVEIRENPEFHDLMRDG